MSLPELAVVRGDILTAPVQAVVNPINIAGAMGAGLALALRRAHPEMYADYHRRVAAGELSMGEPYLWRGAAGAAVIGFPTKRHWREDSRWPNIEAGIARLAEQVGEWGIESLAVPALGCGLGGLSWEATRPLLVEHLGRVPARVLLYEPR